MVSEGWPVLFEITSISSRRDGTTEEIDLRHEPRHLHRHLAPQPVGLHEINGREEAGLAEKDWATRQAPGP